LDITVPPLFVDGANTPPEEVLHLVKMSPGQSDVALGHLKPFCADLQPDLQLLQFPSLLLKLPVDPVQLLRQRPLFPRDLLRLLPLPIQLLFYLTELFALLAKAR
jgi:hypothetical protein